ncbi:unnamed protein product [Ceutorhynchus assimilis]|uniref:C2H2-type domain-containing protein n=1 Tax=Ceutorhynchus assimilis TaxID=467358 RepID=A0A9N9MKI8_9CUCU|nr:unnamed protein product [Ceutorhynchus assimilis]
MDPIEKLITEKLYKLVTSEYCELCDVEIVNEITKRDHYNGRRHYKNLEWFREEERYRLSHQKINHETPTQSIENTKLYCKSCNKTVGSQDELLKHNGTEAHQINVACYCEFCSIYTSSKNNMWQHLRGEQHKKKLIEGCFPIDGEYSSSRDSLSNVLQNLMLIDICKICNLQLPNIQRYKTHYSSESHETAVKQWLQRNQDSVNQPKPVKKVTDETKSEEKANNETVETNVMHYCFICKLQFPSKDRHQHVNSFPHSILYKEKQELLKKGISEVYLEESQGSIVCTLCSITLYNFPIVIDHTNRSKHIINYLKWHGTAKRVTQDSKIKHFYCKVCNKELDGTSYADRHYEEESHIKNLDKIGEVSNATSEILELQNKSTQLHAKEVSSKDILVVTPWPPKFPDLIKPKNCTDVIDKDSSAPPAEAALKSSSTTTNKDDDKTNKADKNDQIVVTSTNYSEFSCYICDVLLSSKKENDLHRQSFQHSALSEEKERLLKEGILDEYLTATVDGVMCELCSVILCNPIGLNQHKNGLKHSNEYFKWRLNSKKVTSESETEPFHCKDPDETSSYGQHYTNKYHSETDIFSQKCNNSNITEELHNKSPLHLENEQKNNPKSDSLTISYTDFVTLLSTTFYGNSNKPEEKSENLSISTTEPKENENLKHKVLEELKKLVQKLYYSEQVPYDFSFKYLQKINKEVDEIIENKEKQDFPIELDNENEIAFDNEYYNYYCEKSEAVDSDTVLEEEFNNDDFNKKTDKTSFEDLPPQTQYIPDLLNEIIDRKQEVVETVEKEVLNEIECLLKRIDNIEEEPVLEEILESLKGFNDELESVVNIQEINSCVKKKVDENNVEKPSESNSKTSKLQEMENSTKYYPVLKTILDYGLYRFLPTRFNN